MIPRSSDLRKLLADKKFLHMPSVSDPLGARLVQSVGFEAAYVGGYVTGATLGVSEPLLTMIEQVSVAHAAAASVSIPVLADAGAGFGEPLHVMRTVREFIGAGIAGIHIEDQVFPKRAHYHRHAAEVVAAEDYLFRIRYACRERDKRDPAFVIIARTDTCRSDGLDLAADRINRAADEGADLGLLFPRNPGEAERAPRACRVPLVYVQSRGNSDGRPLFTSRELEQMGYVACIDAQIMIATAFHFLRDALTELRSTGAYRGLSEAKFVEVRKAIENMIDLEQYYAIEEETVHGRRPS